MITRLDELTGASCEACLFFTLTGGGPHGECKRRPDPITKLKADWCGEFIPEGGSMMVPKDDMCAECPGECCPLHPHRKDPETATETAPTAPTAAPVGPTAAPSGPTAAPAAPPHSPPVADGEVVKERCYRLEYRSGMVQQVFGFNLFTALVATQESEKKDSIVSVTLLSEVNLGFHKEV